MLIQTQNKNMLVNSDNLAYIHVDRAVSVIAIFTAPALASICLGTYNSVEDCKKVLNDIFACYNVKNEHIYEMPQKEEVANDWHWN